MDRPGSEHAGWPGPIEESSASGASGLEFYSYVPRSFSRQLKTTLLVAVHGISRNALELISSFAPYAEDHGFCLLAPKFDPERFDDYQRLGRMGRGRRADLALHDAIETFSRGRGRDFDRMSLFGFSGGGQFVHRYLMAYPEQVASAVIASAGWYTAPDPGSRYPRGLRVAGDLPGVRFDPGRFLQVPILTLVGDRDTERDASVRTSSWVDRSQGRTRVERAKRWVHRMRKAARRVGVDGRFDLAELRDVGHSFSDCVEAGLADRLFEFISSVEWGERRKRVDGPERGGIQ